MNKFDFQILFVYYFRVKVPKNCAFSKKIVIFVFFLINTSVIKYLQINVQYRIYTYTIYIYISKTCSYSIKHLIFDHFCKFNVYSNCCIEKIIPMLDNLWP